MSGANSGFDSIRRAKEEERIAKKERIRTFIEEALKHADIYVNGDKVNISSRDVTSRINEALGKLVSTRYHKLTYMETAPELSDIVVSKFSFISICSCVSFNSTLSSGEYILTL